MDTETILFAAPRAMPVALALLASAQVIAAPTDTVYGVMCSYDSPTAIEHIYEAKNRPPHKALPVLIADTEQLSLLTAGQLPAQAARLVERFWPGALTVVVPARPELPAALTAGQPSIAVRMPDHERLRSLIRQAGPLAATSANLSGKPDPRTAAEVAEQLAGRIPLILADDEESDRRKVAIASTIVDLTTIPPAILRAGPLEHAVRALLEAA
ncbi:MAG: threonylcarbamoyl-AMP synthase [Caldilineaceae bacterium]|nr:threonylcarbamoyl-AMP synthase [Caldilineaceae bacterium]